MDAPSPLDDLIKEVNGAPQLSTAAPSVAVATNATLDQPWSPTLVLALSGGILTFGLLVCGIMMVLMAKGRRSTDLLRAFSLPLIIISAVFLVVTGYSAQQISPVTGLLGAIAGYILGANGGEAAKKSPDSRGLHPQADDVETG